MEKLKSKNDILDVIIVGAGPAGSSTALLLAQAGWSVGIIEKKEFPRRKVCGEFISATNIPLLKKLGILDYYLSSAGPEIHRVGLYAGKAMIATPMPAINPSHLKWGRALGREHLDTALLTQATQAGAKVWQPCEFETLQRQDGLFICSIKNNDRTETISAPLLIMANGSWEGPKTPHQASDLLGFKAHFINSSLPNDLMPLLAYPGGYGGMVHSDNGRTSLSCCIRRDILLQARQNNPGMHAGEAVLHYIKTQCLGVEQTLLNATIQQPWLACGPIRPGIRKKYDQGIFYVGNIAGEAHPIVAEGISMGMQSGWVLAQILIKHQKNLGSDSGVNFAGKEYSQQWRKHFANRIYAAALFAKCAMYSRSQALVLPVIKRFPNLLNIGAKLSGKIQQIVPLDKNN